ncbi:MAG: serine hydrolase domain-containing protein [Dehalococcoidia bacterium]
MTSNIHTSGMSDKRLSLIDDHITKNYLENERLTGALTVVYRKGRLAHYSTLGLSDREQNKPVLWDTIYRIYSMTKPITSTALMMLYERGLFQLDDPVEEFIPEFKGIEVYVSGDSEGFITEKPKRAMTIGDLLSHQSGLTYGFMHRTEVDAAYRKIGLDRNNQKNLKEFIIALSNLPLEFSPGDRWNYSVATDVCGYLIEVLSGKKLDKFFKENIFEPLAMEDTGFHIAENKFHRVAANYLYHLDGPPKLIEEKSDAYVNLNPSFLSGGGGLFSTAEDYLTFCRMILNKGYLRGERLLSRKTVELMSSNHLRASQSLADIAYGRWSESTFNGVGFGLGFSVLIDPARAQISGTQGELAWGGMASTAFWIDPVEELITIFMTQLVPSSTYNIRRELRTLVYSAIED